MLSELSLNSLAKAIIFSLLNRLTSIGFGAPSDINESIALSRGIEDVLTDSAVLG